MKNIPSKRLILFQIFLIFVLPTMVLYTGVVPMGWRFFFLIFGTLILYGIIVHEKWNKRDFGFRTDNFKKSIIPYTIFTFLGLLLLFGLDALFDLQAPEGSGFFWRTIAFFIPISFLQEIGFRGFLIPRLKMIYQNTNTVILFNALLFALIHVIYPDIDLGLPLSFIGGIFFAWIYIKYPNMWLVSISHAILNLTALLLGFFVPIF